MRKVSITAVMSIASPDFPCKISYHFFLPKEEQEEIIFRNLFFKSCVYCSPLEL